MRDGVLDRGTILALMQAAEPLIQGYLDLEAQLQPNGFDLTLKEMREFTSSGKMGPGSGASVLSETRELPFGADGYLRLPVGSFLATLNEIVHLPLDVMGLARPRSSLLRSGVAVHTAVWDAGYRGRSQVLLTVHNPFGYRLARNARVVQMVFLSLDRPLEEGYRGRFLGENL